MQRRHRRLAAHALAALAAAVMGCLALFPATPVGAEDCEDGRFTEDDVTSYLQCSVPSLSDSVAPGDEVTFAGGGFKAGSSIEITLHSDPIRLTTTTADRRGSFSVTVVIPSSVPVGDHRLEAVGVDPDGNPLTVTMALVVSKSDAGSTALPLTGSDLRRSLGVGVAVTTLGVAAVVGARARRATA